MIAVPAFTMHKSRTRPRVPALDDRDPAFGEYLDE